MWQGFPSASVAGAAAVEPLAAGRLLPSEGVSLVAVSVFEASHALSESPSSTSRHTGGRDGNRSLLKTDVAGAVVTLGGVAQHRASSEIRTSCGEDWEHPSQKAVGVVRSCKRGLKNSLHTKHRLETKTSGKERAKLEYAIGSSLTAPA